MMYFQDTQSEITFKTEPKTKNMNIYEWRVRETGTYYIIFFGWDGLQILAAD